MRSLQSLYRMAEIKNIEIINFPLPENGSMSLMGDDGGCYIGMDDTAFDTGVEERVHLSHELGHCVTGSFYNRHAAMDVRQKHENRADKWSIRKLIPRADLDRAVADGHTDLWDLAEFFGVTEDFIKKAVCYYTHGNLAVDLYF